MAIASRLFAVVFAMGSFGSAPFQCASKPGPDRRIEEEPGQALYALAEKFKAEGNEKARAETLDYIVKKYPTSRYAEQARLDLGTAK